MQLQIFNQPVKKDSSRRPILATLRNDTIGNNVAEQLLSKNYISIHGMKLLRQYISKAKRQRDWTQYFTLIKKEMDFKKGLITLDQILKKYHLEKM